MDFDWINGLISQGVFLVTRLKRRIKFKAHRLVLRTARLELRAVQTHMAQRSHVELQRHAHRLLEAGPEEVPPVLAEIAQHPEVRAALARDVHEPQILVAARNSRRV